MNVWDLTPLFKNEKELEKSALSLQNECEKFEAKYSDKFLNLSDEEFFAALNEYENLLENIARLQIYVSLVFSKDTSKGAYPAFKGLYGFPNAACLSLNEVIIHGIPDETILQEGDILGVDLGSKLNGYFGDSARTLPVGKISKADEELIACSKDALEFAIKTIRVGMHFKELSFEIEKFIRARGFVPLYGFCGHGIGKHPHEEPEIPNYLEGNNPKSGPKIKTAWSFIWT